MLALVFSRRPAANQPPGGRLDAKRLFGDVLVESERRGGVGAKRRRVFNREVHQLRHARSPRRRRAAAYHEAGHAVMARYVGGRLIRVCSAFEVRDVPNAKAVDRRRLWIPSVQWIPGGTEDDPKTIGRRVLFKYAGYVAEKRGCGEASRFAAATDFRLAAELLGRIHDPAHVATAEVGFIQEVETILAQPNVWQAVVAVAEVLYKAGEMHPAAATRLIDGRLAGGGSRA